MTDFKIHFFKENERINLSQEVISLFKNKDIFSDCYFEINQYDDEIIIEYIDNYLPYKANFKISDVSVIRSERLIQINPKFVDINFRLEVPFSTPNYFAKKLFKIVGLISQKLKLAIYTEFFQDVRQFDQQYLETLYAQLREKYKQKRPYEFTDFVILQRSKLDQILQYVEQKEELEDFYKDKKIAIPSYHYLIDLEDRFYLAIDWNEQEQIIFPPFIDFIFYTKPNEQKVLYANEVLSVLENLIENVPGYSKEAKIIKKEKLRKATKLIHKYAFSKVDHTFRNADLENIID